MGMLVFGSCITFFCLESLIIAKNKVDACWWVCLCGSLTYYNETDAYLPDAYLPVLMDMLVFGSLTNCIENDAYLPVLMGMLVFGSLTYYIENEEEGTGFVSIPQVNKKN